MTSKKAREKHFKGAVELTMSHVIEIMAIAYNNFKKALEILVRAVSVEFREYNPNLI